MTQESRDLMAALIRDPYLHDILTVRAWIIWSEKPGRWDRLRSRHRETYLADFISEEFC